MIVRADANVRILALFLAALLASVLSQASCAHKIEQNVLTIETREGPRVFHVELADTPGEHKSGLMNRMSLPQDSGMLFMFGKIEKKVFWMKDTLIPLDILFIAEDGIIQHIHHMARPLDRTRITAERPIKAALEINGGMAETLGIKEGDKVIHPLFRNDFDQ